MDEYVARLVEGFREVRRVMRDDATLWLNLGDGYANDGKWGGETGGKQAYLPDNDRKRVGREHRHTGLKPKDLIGVPWRVAFALQADGWWLRSAITWCKRAPMPESVRDRPTSATEMVFLLTKNSTYFYDQEAVREDISASTFERWHGIPERTGGNGLDTVQRSLATGVAQSLGANPAGRNLWNYWLIGPEPLRESHYAAFPTALVEPCIKAGTSQRGACPQCGAPYLRCVEHNSINPWEERKHNGAGRGVQCMTTGWRPACECNAGPPIPATVLDPFFGAGTTGLVADRLQRDCIGIELNAAYAALAERRIAEDAGPMFETVTTEPGSQLEMFS